MLRVVPLMAVALASCGSARAGIYDPSDDVHCHTLSLYWTAVTIKEMKADDRFDDADFSALVVGQWYSMRFAAQASRVGRTVVDAQAKPLFEAIGVDFEASKRAYLACGDRAVADPAFETFARSAAEKLENMDRSRIPPR